MSTATSTASTTELTGLAGLTPGVWSIDAGHSAVSFSARHLMVSKVRGRFESFAGTITVDADPLKSTVDASVETTSINTGDDGRDDHLRGADFFDVEQFPAMTLTTDSIATDGDAFVLHAQLTIKGVTRPVDFELEFEGVATDPWGNTKAGFTASTEINRKDFGLQWNVALESGGMLVGEKVKLQLDVEAVKA